MGQVAALVGVFGVESSSLLDRGEPVFDAELVEALRDETIREISHLPERERRLVLGIVRQFVGAERAGTRPDSGESVDRGYAR